MPVDIGSRLLVTWRDVAGSPLAVAGTVHSWYSHDFDWGTLTGAILDLEKPLRARGTQLDSTADFGKQGMTPDARHLLLVPRHPSSLWPDHGRVQVELRPSDPSLHDEPGWWLAADGDYELSGAGSRWTRLAWRRALTGSAITFGLGAFTAAIGGGGSARHLAFPGTPEWPEGAVAALIGGVLAGLGLAVTIRALWEPRVRTMATTILVVMVIVAFFLLNLGVFIAAYGDPA